MIPVSVLERLFTALLAAGVSTAFPEDNGVLVLGVVGIAPIMFPEDPRLSAFAVLGVFEPPVPFTVLPLDVEAPDVPPPEEEPPDVCPKDAEVTHAKKMARVAVESFMAPSLYPRILPDTARSLRLTSCLASGRRHQVFTRWQRLSLFNNLDMLARAAAVAD